MKVEEKPQFKGEENRLTITLMQGEHNYELERYIKTKETKP